MLNLWTRKGYAKIKSAPKRFLSTIIKMANPRAKGTKARIDSFDIQGNRVEEINYRATGTIHYIMSFKYDGSGNKTEYAKYSGNEHKLNYKESIKFDSKGNKLI